MKSLYSSTVLVAVLAALLAPTASAGTVTLDVNVSSAPNVFGSPSWSGYAVNALNSLENGLGDIGDRSTAPTAYEVLTGSATPGDMMVTSFHSWRGMANPSGAFASELGNRLHGGLHVYGDGTTRFALEDLNFHLHTSDGDFLHFAGDFVGYSYNGTTRYGIDWGADRAKGGGDDVVYTSGNGTTLVDELVYVGVGNAYWPGGGPVPAGTEQDEIDSMIAYIYGQAPLSVTFDYWITADDQQTHYGSAAVTVTAVPLPTAAWAGFFSLGLLALGTWVRRRRASAAA